MKNPIHPIGNRTRDLPVCSALHQPTAPPYKFILYWQKSVFNLRLKLHLLHQIHYSTYCMLLYQPSCTSFSYIASSYRGFTVTYIQISTQTTYMAY
jgi:hypothetical protein